MHWLAGFVTWRNAAVMLLSACASCAAAQISLGSAVGLAVKNDPRVKMARADVDRAKALLSETKDAFVPSVSSSGGIGKSVGVPLSTPVVFSIAAQSLVINFSQINYVRAADAGVDAATYALEQAQNDVADDAVTTYISLDNARQRQKALAEASAIASRLVKIVQERYSAGTDAHIELTRVMYTAATIRLQNLQVENEIGNLSEHLGRMMGLGTSVTTVHDSIPAFAAIADTAKSAPDGPGMKAALATAASKDFMARGDAKYRLLPQVAFGAGYSRISTVGNNYAQYYPGFDPDKHPGISYNSLDLGVQISVPLLDLLHTAKARASRAEAARAKFEAENQRMQLATGQSKALRTAKELEARAEIASLARDLAQDQIDAIELQLKADATPQEGAQPVSPKDEQNARLQERQRYVEMLQDEAELRQAEVSLMRQTGQLESWLQLTIEAPAAGSTTAIRP